VLAYSVTYTEPYKPSRKPYSLRCLRCAR